MYKIRPSLLCICAKQWKQCSKPWNQCSTPWPECINKKYTKKVEIYTEYNIPYTVGMAELGYEYDFLNNRRIKLPKKTGAVY